MHFIIHKIIDMLRKTVNVVGHGHLTNFPEPLGKLDELVIIHQVTNSLIACIQLFESSWLHGCPPFLMYWYFYNLKIPIYLTSLSILTMLLHLSEKPWVTFRGSEMRKEFTSRINRKAWFADHISKTPILLQPFNHVNNNLNIHLCPWPPPCINQQLIHK